MTAEKITVKNFRNIEDAELCLKDGINVLYGPNGSGKTSLAEALYFFSVGRSFRVTRPSMLVKYGEIASSAELLMKKESNGRKSSGQEGPRNEAGSQKSSEQEDHCQKERIT
jgi:recombinational DNA repair ATPase RecF